MTEVVPIALLFFNGPVVGQYYQLCATYMQQSRQLGEEEPTS